MTRTTSFSRSLAIIGLFVTLMLLPLPLPSQTFTVSGTVSSPTQPVRNALLTFFDNADTTKRATALTDTLGHYRMSLTLTSIKESGNLPSDFQLAQNYPNPFSGSTAIPYELGTQSDVRVTIYDILGREVRSFNVGSQTAGNHIITWNGRNNLSKQVTSGVYFYRMSVSPTARRDLVPTVGRDGQVGGKTMVRKMIFGIGESRAVLAVPVPPAPRNGLQPNAVIALQPRSFTLRIANTDSTYPPVVTTQNTNFTFEGDTTANVTVSEFVDPYAVTVIPDSTRQVIRGFGAANILPWRPDMTSTAINNAFGTGTGQVGLSILRLRVPSSQSEFSMNLPTAQLAKGMGVTLIGSPWSPPAALKSNNNIVGGYLNDSSYAAYAAHLKSFADYMSSNGAPLTAISVQNEPDVSVTYESCDWSAGQLFRFARDFAPQVGTPIIIPESFHFDHSLSDSILEDPVAVNNISIIGGHLYGGGLASYPLAESKGKEVWMTEWLDTDTSWAKTIAVAKQINDVMTANMNAYIWWYIVRFYGPILENSNVSRRGYVMSQWARFVRPGAFRVKTTGRPLTNVDVTAYTRSGKLTMVLVNRSYASVQQTLLVPVGAATSFTVYATSANKNCFQTGTIPVYNGHLAITMEALSVVTLVGN